jgi:hypothetical protein
MMAITIREQMTAIKAQIDALKAEYSEEYVWGVRWDDADLSVGHIFPASRVWDDGDPTDELCSGTSCIQDTHLRCISETNYYVGTAYIVCGLHAGYGEDPGEILMSECEIMAVPTV